MEFIFEPEFWVAISFFIFLALVLYLGVHKKVAAALDARAATIAKELAAAKRLREEAEKVLADYKIARAQAEALREVRNAAADAAVIAAQSLIAKSLTPETADKLVKQGIEALKSRLN